MMCSSSGSRREQIRVVDLVTTDEDQKFAPAAGMAGTILEIIQKHGRCTPCDLNEKGFTPDDIKRHWHMAYALARVELNLLSESSTHLQTIIRKKS